MATCTCWACKTQFECARISRLCCSVECRKMYQSAYDHDRYLEFRNGNREKRRKMLIEKYSVSSSNLYKFEAVCDECLQKFYYDYSIFQHFHDVYVSKYNVTQWGASCCPNCGLVEKSKCDEIFKPADVMNYVERKEFLYNLTKSRKPIINREAVYIRNVIDFIEEAVQVRKMVNRIWNKGKLTQEQVNECIRVLFQKIKEQK